MENKYKDVKDKIKFVGKTMANKELDGKKMIMELLITRKETSPLLDLDWMEILGMKLDMGDASKIKLLSEDEDSRVIFTENHTVDGMTLN